MLTARAQSSTKHVLSALSRKRCSYCIGNSDVHGVLQPISETITRIGNSGSDDNLQSLSETMLRKVTLIG